MKRKGNLYENIYKIENIMEVFEEVCRNTKAKRKVNRFKEFKCIYISRIYRILKNREYRVGPYVHFTIYEPKKREIVSQGMIDKVVNHLVSRYILYPAILPCLIDTNVASRSGLGTKAGLEAVNKFQRKCKIKYDKYYILKCDISKFFASINKDRLKEKLKRKIKDKDALKILFDIIDSKENGLGIGNMTSQVFAIFYLNDMDHYIKEDLGIKYYVRYQDDFLLFHESKEYLKYCFEEIKKFLKKEKLELNAKSRIYTNNNNFIFLGRNQKGRYARYRRVKRKMKKTLYLYNRGAIDLMGISSTLLCYKNLCSQDVKVPLKFQ